MKEVSHGVDKIIQFFSSVVGLSRRNRGVYVCPNPGGFDIAVLRVYTRHNLQCCVSDGVQMILFTSYIS